MKIFSAGEKLYASDLNANFEEVGDLIISFEAGEDIADNDALYFDISDYKVYICDASDADKINFIGFAQEAKSSGENIRVMVGGINNQNTGLSPNHNYFLDGTVTYPIAKKDYYNGGGEDWSLGGWEGFGQSFTASSSYTLEKIALQIKKTGTLTGNLTIKVYSGGPDGTLLATSDNYDVSGLTTGYQTIDFQFSGDDKISIASSSVYYIVVTNDLSWDGSSQIGYFNADSSGSYAGGEFYRYNGSDWTSLSSRDLWFEVYSEATSDDNSGKIIVDSARAGHNSVEVGKAYTTTALFIKGDNFELVASDNLITSADTASSVAGTSYTKKKEILLNDVNGTIRVKFDLRIPNGIGNVLGKIYKNGVAFGTERSTGSTSAQTYSEDLAFSNGDLIQVYIKNDNASGDGEISNFRIYYDKQPKVADNPVNLD